MKRTLVSLLGGLALAGSIGCSDDSKAPNDIHYKDIEFNSVLANPRKYIGVPITIKGIPLSSEFQIYYSGEQKYALVIGNDEQQLLAYFGESTSNKNLIQVAAIVSSEINDDDNEPIEVRGILNDERILQLNSIKANGYNVNLK